MSLERDRELNELRKRLASGQVNFSALVVYRLIAHIDILTGRGAAHPPVPAGSVPSGESVQWMDMTEIERSKLRARWREGWVRRAEAEDREYAERTLRGLGRLKEV